MKKHRVFSVLIILALMLSGVTAALAHGGDVNLIHACANKVNGSLRLVGANDSCKINETAIDWGIVGPAGSQGPAGPQGDPGISGYEVISTSAGYAGRTNPVSVGIRCQQGKQVLGGGGAAEGAGWYLIGSGPFVENTGWQVTYAPDANGGFAETVTLQVWAICAFVQ